MKPCILCSKPTTGSVGAAGMKWTRICPACKKSEDKALEARVLATAQTMDAIFGAHSK